MNIFKIFKRDPDRLIYRNEGGLYLKRWHLIPRNKWFNIYLHHFMLSDNPTVLHDHPWWWMSLILKGGYVEHTPKGSFFRRSWRPRFGKATDLHRVELLREWRVEYDSAESGRVVWSDIPVWTIFVTGRTVRRWGFQCPQGWRDWQDFVKRDGKKNEVGVGCD